MARVGIALGSNLGDCAAQIAAAIQQLREIATRGEAFLEASLHRTAPLHCPPGSPDFLNTVVEIGFDGSETELLAHTQRIEKSLGRARHPTRNAPRVIDLDLLYFGGQTVTTTDLVLPHPRLHERRFVLAPLAEIRPELVLPGRSKSIAELLADLPTTVP